LSHIDKLDTFEVACKHFLGDFSNFKDLIFTQVQSLDGLEWSFEKGSVKNKAEDKILHEKKVNQQGKGNENGGKYS